MSKKISDFLTYLKLEKEANGIYIWGAQGEQTIKLTIEDILKMEATDPTGKESAQIVLNFIGSLNTAGKNLKKSRAFDCSGLGMYYFIANNIFLSDMSANDIYKQCTIIGNDYRQPGDFVFVLNSAGKATHIGYIGDNDEVTESRGKKFGVVSYKFKDRAWNAVGRPAFWEYEMTRTLQLENPYMRGDDVGQLQARLTSLNYPCGKIDNIFGNKTTAALIKAQKALLKGKYKEGVMDKKTAEALGFAWSVNEDGE